MGKKVYVVDDDPDLVKVVSFRLKSAGFDVQSFTSGASALEAIQSSPPQAIVLDIQMPDMTGQELASKVDKNLPIIFLTGKVDVDQAGIQKDPKRELFVKPCDFEALVAKINEMAA